MLSVPLGVSQIPPLVPGSNKWRQMNCKECSSLGTSSEISAGCVARWCPHGPPSLPSPFPGLLWQLRPSDVEVELLAHTRNVVSWELEEETGLHTGWIQNGGLFIASNKPRLDEYKRLMSVSMKLPASACVGIISLVLSGDLSQQQPFPCMLAFLNPLHGFALLPMCFFLTLTSSVLFAFVCLLK